MADAKISSLAGATTLTGTELVTIVQGGANVNTTPAAIKTYIAAEPAKGADDNYVTDAEKASLHSHSNKTALDAVTNVNTGDQDLSGYGAKAVVNTWTAGQAGEVTALTVSANAIAINLSDSNNFSVTLQATTGQTLSAPSNPVAGMSGAIEITQNATPSALAYNGFWKFSGAVVPTVTATNGAKDIFTYYCPTASYAVCSLIKAVA